MAKPRVVIIGAGFGGLQCARKLDGTPFDVLVIDRVNYHLFTPLLYQVASSLLNPADIAYPLRRVFRGSPNVRVRQAEVTGIDFAAKEVLVADGPPIAYDTVVLAAGSTTTYFGNDAIEHAALGLKTLPQAMQLRNHILNCLEEATHATDADVSTWLTFVISGAGPTGVEYAGALSEFVRLVLPLEYPEVPANRVRIVLVEGKDDVLSTFAPRLARYARKTLVSFGVEVRTGTLVTGADRTSVHLSDGDVLASRTLVWTAGVRPADVLTALDVSQSRSGRVVVDGHLRIGGRHDAFAIGDLASVVEEDIELPMVSPPAMQEGRYVASLLASGQDLSGPLEDMAQFRYVDKGTMATIGRSSAVASLGPLRLTGLIGWLTWLLVHVYYLIGFRNRLAAIWSWSLNYVRYERPVRINVRAAGDPDEP